MARSVNRLLQPGVSVNASILPYNMAISGKNTTEIVSAHYPINSADDVRRSAAILNEANGLIDSRLVDFSLGMMGGTMALGRYWNGTMNKSYASYQSRHTVDNQPTNYDGKARN